MEPQNKLYIIDYIGNSFNSNPIGHPVKIISQIQSLIEDEYKVENALPCVYGKVFKIDIPLSKFIDISDKEKKSFYRLRSFFKKIINLMKVFRLRDGILFFINTDITLYLFLIFCFKKRKVAVINFNNYVSGSGLTGRVKKIIYKVARNKVNIQFNTYDLSSNEFIPDYYYTPENNQVTSSYINPKVDFLVIGTMSEAKDLLGVIDAIKTSDYSLKIIGKFYSDTYYDKVVEKIANCANITVVNKYLENDEYLNEILNAKYIILPYDINIYHNITSGVFLDAMYNNIPVIAPCTPYFLQFQTMNIGILYQDMNDITKLIEQADYEQLKANIKEFNEKQSKRIVQSKIVAMLKKLI